LALDEAIPGPLDETLVFGGDLNLVGAEVCLGAD